MSRHHWRLPIVTPLQLQGSSYNFTNNSANGGSVGAGALVIGGRITGSIGTTTLTLNGIGFLSIGALQNISGSNTCAGPVTLGSAARINSDSGLLTLSHPGAITGADFGLTVGGAGDTMIHSRISAGSGALTKDGAGTLTLTAASAATGRVTFSGGAHVLAFGEVASDILSGSSPLSLAGEGLLLTAPLP